MISITLTPRSGENLYGLLVKKEVSLRKQNRGTFHRSARKGRNIEKWSHSSHKGWVWFEKCIGGVAVASVQARNVADESKLLSAFIGFLDRHFRDSIGNINITYRVD